MIDFYSFLEEDFLIFETFCLIFEEVSLIFEEVDFYKLLIIT